MDGKAEAACSGVIKICTVAASKQYRNVTILLRRGGRMPNKSASTVLNSQHLRQGQRLRNAVQLPARSEKRQGRYCRGPIYSIGLRAMQHCWSYTQRCAFQHLETHFTNPLCILVVALMRVWMSAIYTRNLDSSNSELHIPSIPSMFRTPYRPTTKLLNV